MHACGGGCYFFGYCVIKLDKWKKENKTDWLTSVNCYIVVLFLQLNKRCTNTDKTELKHPQTITIENMSSFFNVSSLAGNVFSTPVGQRIGNFLIIINSMLTKEQHPPAAQYNQLSFTFSVSEWCAQLLMPLAFSPFMKLIDPLSIITFVSYFCRCFSTWNDTDHKNTRTSFK